MTVARLAALAAAVALGGCAIPRMPAPQPSIAVIDRIGAARLPAMAVGSFTAAPGLSDKALGIRVSQVRPEGGSFAAYLGETLKAQLAAAGKLDATAPIAIGGTLTESDVGAPIGEARGRLGAEFVVTRDGRELLRKRLRVERRWGSSYFGVIAIDKADRMYTALYADLVGTLIDDPDFRAAVGAVPLQPSRGGAR
ncbi:MAG: hypothetical protein ACTHJR_11215 [Sphingomonas sp.]|uniref:hypothetical protein n=1 Tax=Sphingomonas sp. TaxID=28214 RepID=UPI003F7EDA71